MSAPIPSPEPHRRRAADSTRAADEVGTDDAAGPSDADDGPSLAFDRRSTDRRAGDRRKRERRSAPRPSDNESWFATPEGRAESPWRDTLWGEAGDSRFADGWHSASWQRAAFGSPAGATQPPDAVGSAAFERLYRVFIGARAVLGTVLIATAAVYGVFGVILDVAVLAICFVYAALAISLWLLPRFRTANALQAMARLRSPRWLATIGVDIVCFIALYALSAESGLNSIPLLVLPILMAGTLTPRLLALATAAAVTLALLGVAWLAVLAGGRPTVLLAQAGIAGSGFFVITVLAGEVARRLAREELTARGSLQLARQQAQLNRLVIREMTDGVLVIDRDGRVRTANPAARALLAVTGLVGEAPFSLRAEPAWRALVEAVEQAFSSAAWPEGGRDVLLDFDGGVSRTLRVRVRFARRHELLAGDAFCVLFLEDVRSVQARSRQEKLAAMGRVSAGVAHEIRNPLAAISQANALLAEDALGAQQHRLTRMVADNVERLKRIVDDVMAVAPGSTETVRAIDARAEVATACLEWRRAGAPAPVGTGVLRLDLPAEPIGVLFDAEHLRRVLVNLLDNARRHATGAPGAIVVRLHGRDEHEATLSVTSDGPPIAPDVERFLFEPFFSTRSRGTGLGLYICRELCERYGAAIRFRLHPEPERLRNEFTIALRRAAMDPATAQEAALAVLLHDAAAAAAGDALVAP